LSSCLWDRRLALAPQQRLAQHEDHEAGDHAQPRQAEARPPADRHPQEAAEDRGPERTQIDAVIIEGEPRIAPAIARRIELADDGRDVGLQEPDADDDQGQGEPEDVQIDRVPARDAQLVLALGQHAGDRGAGRQALNGEVAGLGGRHRVGPVLDDQPRGPAFPAAF
jgi:hypothetical protein